MFSLDKGIEFITSNPYLTAGYLLVFLLTYLLLYFTLDIRESFRKSGISLPNSFDPWSLDGWLNISLLVGYFILTFLLPAVGIFYDMNKVVDAPSLLKYPYQAVFVGEPQRPILMQASQFMSTQGLFSFDINSKELKKLKVNTHPDSTIAIETVGPSGVCLSKNSGGLCFSPEERQVEGDFRAYEELIPDESFDLLEPLVLQLVKDVQSKYKFELKKANLMRDGLTRMKIENHTGYLVMIEYQYMRNSGRNRTNGGSTYTQTTEGILAFLDRNNKVIWTNEYIPFSGNYPGNDEESWIIYMAAAHDAKNNRVWLYSPTQRIYLLDLEDGKRKLMGRVEEKHFTFF